MKHIKKITRGKRGVQVAKKSPQKILITLADSLHKDNGKHVICYRNSKIVIVSVSL